MSSKPSGRTRIAAGDLVLPLVVLVAGLALSGGMFFLLRRDSLRREEVFFGERVAEAQAAIRLRMTAYTDALRGGASFIGASASVDREQWRLYAESLQLRERYPGINGLGVILSVAPDQLRAWRNRVRSPELPEPAPMPFPASTPGPDDPLYLISYLEGNVGGPLPIGRNIGTEPSRREAAERARDSGGPQINRRIPGSRDTQRRSGLILYMPFYAKGAKVDTVAERRAAHLGWVYAQVYPDVFLDGVLGPLGQALRVHFFEAGGVDADRLLYSSAPDPGPALPAFERVTELEMVGQRFNLGWNRGPRFPVAERSSAILASSSCAAATFLLAGLVLSLQSVGRRANLIAEERTAQLKASEERARRASDAALEASRLKSEFLANMSHEIRTPMNAVVGMSDLLAGTALEGTQREMVQAIQGGAEHLLAIINDILDISRIEAGKLRLDPMPFELARVLDDTIALLLPRAREKQLRLHAEIAAGCATRFVGDAGRVRQVLTNLIGNAIKFTERGEIRVQASPLAETSERSTIRIAVHDTGIGIAPEVQQRLFQPFSQADGSTTRKYGGSGLGLAISLQLVELMGGRMGVESEPGRGSTFWFELPFVRHGGDALPPAPEAKVEVGSLRLLVVEDNAANQVVARLVLARLGHTVDVAADGPSALARLEFVRYDAVFMDCQMPGFDGYETTRQIRAGTVPGVNVAVPIIALTAYATAEDRKKCLDAGMDDYLSKPIAPDDLQAALARCGFGSADRRRARPAAPAAPGLLPVFDPRVLARMESITHGNGQPLAHELLKGYLQSEAADLKRLEELVAGGDGEKLAFRAHSFAGHAAAIGAVEVRAVALALEHDARISDWDAIRRRFESLRTATSRLQPVLLAASQHLKPGDN